MDSFLYQGLRQLINIVDELRDVGLQRYIDLPRICVIGTQSSGKSSVLESLVGVDFLPRGEGVVTRRPLELRMVHLNKDVENKDASAWAIFDDNRSNKYTDFDEVRKEIDRRTDAIAGKKKGISDEPIILTIYAPNCPDLTLIDLPGITRIPLKNSDQTDEVEALTRDMAMRYASDPRTIILSVIPANADISTSDALQLARKADPKGNRTIGVITKIDLMDRGTDAVRMLNGEDVPLRLGYIGVKNRSQFDIAQNMPISTSLELENDYFSRHPIYKSLPSHKLGLKSLCDKLTKVLFKHIQHFLPAIKQDINSRMVVIKDRLEELGGGIPALPAERTQLLWTMINDYCESFRHIIRGNYDKRLQRFFDNQEMPTGAHIRAIFNDLLKNFIQEKLTSSLQDHDIDHAIRLHEGDSLPGFPSPDTFEFLIIPHLRKVYSPVYDCLDRTTQLLNLLLHKISSRIFSRFPEMQQKVIELSEQILQREKDNTRSVLTNVIDAITGYLFTNDSDYLASHGAMICCGPSNAPQEEAPQQNRPSTIQEKYHSAASSAQSAISKMLTTTKPTIYNTQIINEIRERLDAYFHIIISNIRDVAPKTVGFFLVRRMQEKIQYELYSSLNHENICSKLLGEPNIIMEERQTLVAQLSTLENAAKVLQRDPSIAALTVDTIDNYFGSEIVIENQFESSPKRNTPSLSTGPTAATAPELPEGRQTNANIPDHRHVTASTKEKHTGSITKIFLKDRQTTPNPLFGS